MKQFQRIDVPGDNSCFFHSVGICINTTGPLVRQMCVQGLKKYADVSQNGITFRQWIELDGNTLENYVQLLQRPSFWGGAIEMHLLCFLLGRPIAIYELRKDIGYKIAVFREDLQTDVISLLYLNRNHYAALVPAKTYNSSINVALTTVSTSR